MWFKTQKFNPNLFIPNTDQNRISTTIFNKINNNITHKCKTPILLIKIIFHTIFTTNKSMTKVKSQFKNLIKRLVGNNL